jgi:putative ABC transport system permease protein
MFRNYIKIAFRNMAKSKVLAFINIIGLSLGIACAVLIIFFVKDEITFDSFHTKVDRIYRPWTEAKMRGRESVNSATPFNMGKQLEENFEEIEKYTVWTSFNETVEKGDQSYTENINIASPQFFEIFDFEVIDGSVEETLREPGDLIITRDISEKYFGSISVTGELLKIQVGGENREFEIKAVLENVPTNSSLEFEMIVSDEHLKSVFPEQMLTSWFMITGENYLLLAEGTDPDETATKFSSIIDQNLGDHREDMEYAINLQPIADIHLNTDIPGNNAPVSDPKYIYILSGIAILIMAIACINFMTLSLGRSLSRTREIGVRKTLGANRSRIITQFMGEAIMISILSLILGLGLAYMSLGWFNELSGKSLVFDLSLQNLEVFITLAIVAGLLSGFYPAMVMSGVNSSDIIKGKISIGSGKQSLRLILVGSQFVLSIFLIASTLVMNQQLNFLQNKNLGFDKENIVVIPLTVSNARGVRDVVGNGFEKAGMIVPTLKNQPGISDVAIASHTFEPGSWTQIGWMNEEDQQFNFYYNTVDPNYIKTMNMELVSGRDFSEDNQADYRRSIIVNESFVKVFELENPIGSRIPNELFEDHEIIGVVKDFHIASLHQPIEPLVLAMNVNLGFSGAQSVDIGSSVTPKLFIRTKPNETKEALAAIEETWSNIYAEDPYDFSFVDENLREQYDRENNLNSIVTSASLIAILIGCMGLFGLSALTLTARTREVSIRKVFGASRKSLLIILSKNFTIMIVAAVLIASPVSWYFMDKWLGEFEYRIEITPFIFLIAGIITLAITYATISYQTFKVTRTNPVNSLRIE